jgi:hypothetical protein
VKWNLRWAVLDDLDKICAALGCTVADLLEAESLAGAAPERREAAAGGGAVEEVPQAGCVAALRPG